MLCYLEEFVSVLIKYLAFVRTSLSLVGVGPHVLRPPSFTFWMFLSIDQEISISRSLSTKWDLRWLDYFDAAVLQVEVHLGAELYFTRSSFACKQHNKFACELRLALVCCVWISSARLILACKQHKGYETTYMFLAAKRVELMIAEVQNRSGDSYG